VRVPPTDKNPLASSSITTLSNVSVISQLGTFEVVLDNQRLDIGSVVKAKGTISEFRGTKQIDLKRIWVVTTTDEEVQAWAETATFKQEVLSMPWHISSKEHNQIKARKSMEKRKVREYERRKVEHEVKNEARRQAREVYMAQREKKQEMQRRKEEVMMNAGALI
jgi:hypothetical protein